jgi:predicted nucleic acid-binding protein
MAAILIDTNVLVYAHDRGEFAKQECAMDTLERLQLSGTGRLSVQCLAEFFWATTRGPQPKLTVAEAQMQVERLVRAFPVLDVTPLIVLEATRGARDRGMAYWDAQIWATARLCQVSVVFSEDFSSGSVVEGIRFVNPFAGDFRLEDWMA